MDNTSNIYTGQSPTNQIVNLDYTASVQIDTSDISYVYPRQVGSGSTRGTQIIGTGNIELDGSDNQITLTSNDGTSSIAIGEQNITGSQTGVAATSLSTTSSAFGMSITDTNNASINLGISQGGDTELLFTDPTANRLLIGQNSVGVYGVYVSPTGVDVTTATNEQLIFNSNQDIFKIVDSSSTSLPAQNMVASQININTITVAHGLSFIPILQAYGEFTIDIGEITSITQINSYLPLPYNQTDYGLVDSVDISQYQVYCGVDATNIYFVSYYITTNGGSGYDFPAVPIKYYLLQESAASS